ncbi:hypothetical protein DERP_000619 [Dermatophagoides pteronyssinus]|uniref:Uncharacterized protein n=1 Tax=Dermatophagoides pteronyssinus TaxID=6956 RepID=A0ABQ8J0N0_DERPT|nr:hypothetical protein DERP_000619 [Dermatophagoides pteronyssinus]
MDFNQIPFKLRFNHSYKLFNEINDYIIKLDKIVRRNLLQIKVKQRIQFILEENFSHLGSTLKIVQNYLKSSECQIEPNLSMILIKQLDEKLKQFQEDQKEYMLLKNVKNVKVSVKPIPRCWKCLTWKQIDEISMDNVPDSSLKPKNPFCESNNIYEKLYNNDSNDQYVHLDHLLRLFRKQNEHHKQKIILLDETIITLFNNLREYMKTLLKVKIYLDQQQQQQNFDHENAETKSIKLAIENLFMIDDKIDFFSTSSDAFELNSSSICLRLELKNPVKN